MSEDQVPLHPPAAEEEADLHTIENTVRAMKLAMSDYHSGNEEEATTICHALILAISKHKVPFLRFDAMACLENSIKKGIL